MTIIAWIFAAIAVVLAVVMWKKTFRGTALVLFSYPLVLVADQFWNLMSGGDWGWFWPAFLILGFISLLGRRLSSRGLTTAGAVMLVFAFILATNWDIRPDFDNMAAQATKSVEVTTTVIPATTDVDGNTEDIPIVQPTETDDTVTDESSTQDPAIPPTVKCDDGGTFSEMVACINKASNKAEIVAYFNANEIGMLGGDAAGTTWERISAYPADLDSRVILVLNAPDVTDAEARAVAAKSMGELAKRAKIVRRDGVVLINSFTDPSGKVKTYADGRRQVRVITTYADTGKEALTLAYNGQGVLNGCLNGTKGMLLQKEIQVETRVETRTISVKETVNTTSTANSTATVSAPVVTQTATSTSTAPAVTTTVTATASPLPGKTATITLPAESRTSTATTTASAEPAPTVTVVGPGATATVTQTATATVTAPPVTSTVTAPGPTTTVVGPGGSTATVTAPGPTTTVTGPGGATSTVTAPAVTTTVTVTAPPLPGKTATITLPAEVRTNTVTAPAEPGPAVTHTITVTAQPVQTGEPVNP